MTESQNKLGMLRTILRTLGLSPEAIDDIVDRILDFLSDKDKKPEAPLQFPYALRDDFLSPAEQSFFLVLKSAVGDNILVCPKVALGDLFYATVKDPSAYRISTNKIDRKQVDFLLCDPVTARPIGGVELDDSSHNRADRQARDEFVNQVFAVAHLPLVRVPARRAYAMSDVALILAQLDGNQVSAGPAPVATTIVPPAQSTPTATEPASAPTISSPVCPKCGGAMILRTAKSGTNQGGQFWGCANFPKCRTILSVGT